VQGDHGVAPGRLAAQGGRSRHGAVEVAAQGVDHDVADEMHPFRRDAFPFQVVQGGALGGEQQVGDLVGQHPIDLFRHGPVETAQAGFHVDHLHALLGRHQGAGDGGIDVAHHQHRPRPLRVQHRFEGAHDLGGLHGMAGGTHLQIDVRPGNAELLEEAVAHGRVVMLAGMHQFGGDGLVAERRHDGGDLHEIGARAHHANDLAGGLGGHSLSWPAVTV
jgi:hypothetical protein